MKARFALAFSALLLTSGRSSTAQTFEVATMRLSPPNSQEGGDWSWPNKSIFVTHHLALTYLLQLAYGVDASQVGNMPPWADDTFYDINAKPEAGIKLSTDELQPRLQALLAQRLHLAIHHEIRKTRGFALVVAKSGAKLTPTDGKYSAGWRKDTSSGHLEGYNWTMLYLARTVTPAAGFPVVDQTHVAGSYDVSVLYEPDPNAQSDLPLLGDALRKSLGLELKPSTVSVDTIVIDTVERIPAEN